MVDTSQDPERSAEVLGEGDLYRNSGLTDQLNESEISGIIARLGSLVLDEDTVLEEHQREQFNDVVQFFQDGGRECYVKSPTGTGKSVLIVELSKKLIETMQEDDEPQRVIVLAPTIDLVEQIVGGIEEDTGKRRGFKGFAPELEARSINGKMTLNTRIQNIGEAEVLVTTYDTFRNLIAGFVDGEELSEEAVSEQIADLERQENEHKDANRRLKRERDQHLRDACERQDVRHVRQRAEDLIGSAARGEILDNKAGAAVERFLEIADDEGITAERKIQEMKHAARTLTNKRVTMAATWMHKRRRMHRQEFVVEKNGDPDDYIALTEDELDAEARDAFGLDSMERYLAMFLLQNRTARPAMASKLELRKDVDEIERLEDLADDERDMQYHAKGQAKALKTKWIFADAISKFGLVVCDEAHRAIGTETWQAIRDFAERKEIAVVGLTATDEYSDRSLEDYFEQRVHELTKQEAMRRKIVNPIAMFSHDTGLLFKNVSIDANGDYDRATIKQMRLNEERNQIGVNYAQMLSEMGYSGIMPAIPGDGAAHAKVLAEMINNTIMIDPKTGEERFMRACAVDGKTDPELRKEYFRQYEAGEIDWICFVDVIREGWDSDKAKAIINMRPTRSILLATQRVGRIGRTYPGAPVSIAIDLFDGILLEDGGMELPPVLVADVFGMDNVEQGAIAGGVEASLLDSDLERLRQAMPTGVIEAHHSRYVRIVKEAQLIDARGIAKTETGAQRNEWQTFEAIRRGFNGFLPKEIILDAIEGDNPTVRVTNGKSGGNIVPLFNISDVLALHKDAPEINPWRLYKDTTGTDWISPEGCTVLLSKRFPNIASEEISDVLRMIEEEQGQKFEKQVARFRINFNGNPVTRLGYTHLFRLSEVMERLVPYLKDLATLQS